MAAAPRDEFYRKQAEMCEARAKEVRDPVQRDQWLNMAEDWRSLIRPKPTRDKSSTE